MTFIKYMGITLWNLTAIEMYISVCYPSWYRNRSVLMEHHTMLSPYHNNTCDVFDAFAMHYIYTRRRNVNDVASNQINVRRSSIVSRCQEKTLPLVSPRIPSFSSSSGETAAEMILAIQYTTCNAFSRTSERAIEKGAAKLETRPSGKNENNWYSLREQTTPRVSWR